MLYWDCPILTATWKTGLIVYYTHSSSTEDYAKIKTLSSHYNGRIYYEKDITPDPYYDLAIGKISGSASYDTVEAIGDIYLYQGVDYNIEFHGSNQMFFMFGSWSLAKLISELASVRGPAFYGYRREGIWQAKHSA